MLAERHFYFHSVVASRLQDHPAAWPQLRKESESAAQEGQGRSGVCVCVKGGSGVCVCVWGGDIVFNMDSIRCEYRTH